MAQTNINIRMDEDLKKGFDGICNELGINMTVAVTVLAKKMIREKRLPFELSIDPFYMKSNMDALYKSINQLEQGQTVSRTLEELEETADE